MSGNTPYSNLCMCVSIQPSPPNIKSGTVTTVYHNHRTGRKYNKGHKYIFLLQQQNNNYIQNIPHLGFVRFRASQSSIVLRQTVAFSKSASSSSCWAESCQHYPQCLVLEEEGWKPKLLKGQPSPKWQLYRVSLPVGGTTLASLGP